MGFEGLLNCVSALVGGVCSYIGVHVTIHFLISFLFGIAFCKKTGYDLLFSMDS